jgi:hypothetical protein
VHTTPATAVATDQADGTTHPYGVRVGDPVHYWREGCPPLREEYVAPACWHALVLAFSCDARSIWLADLAIVVPEDGSLRIERSVPFMPSFAQAGNGRGGLTDRSYGVGASFHRPITHSTAHH